MKPPGPHIVLSRSEIRRIADALDTVVARYATRYDASRATGISREQIRRITTRPATLTMARVNLDKIGQVIGIDTSGMGT